MGERQREREREREDRDDQQRKIIKGSDQFFAEERNKNERRRERNT